MIFKKIKTFLGLRSIDKDYKSKIKFVYEKLEDKESKLILSSRIDYYSVLIERLRPYRHSIKDRFLRFHYNIASITSPIFRIEELEQYRGKRIAVFGSGVQCEYTQSLLKLSEWRHLYRYIGDNLDNIASLSKDEVLLPIADRGIDKLIEGIKDRYPLVPIHKTVQICLLGTTGNQYFDVFYSKPNEVVVDCGAFDGQTEQDIIKWGGENIKRIYAFELDPENAKKCIDFYKKAKLEDTVTLINKGTYNETRSIQIPTLSIGKSFSGIKDTKSESTTAYVTKIDDAVSDDVTFIKMDIEGAELASLEGAKETIVRCKPRLAICIYHKQSDLYEIPHFLLSIVPEYRFYIRHYTSCMWETVLYAYVPLDSFCIVPSGNSR